MNSIKLCMIAVMGIAITMTLKQWKADWLPLVRICFLLLFGTVILTMASPLIDYVHTLTETAEAQAYTAPLLKALGVAVLTHCCGEICRESGESSIATGVETAGKVEILLLSLPLLEELLGIARSLLETGV